MNELALIFGRMNIDIMDVIKVAAARWNCNVYYPGAGVGAHSLPVDSLQSCVSGGCTYVYTADIRGFVKKA
jgi:hypothetical protein